MRVGEHLGWFLWGEAGVCFLSFPEGVTGLYFVYCCGQVLGTNFFEQFLDPIFRTLLASKCKPRTWYLKPGT